MPNLHFISGPEILVDIGGLTTDLVHPGDLAMIGMGENMAKRTAPVVLDPSGVDGYDC